MDVKYSTGSTAKSVFATSFWFAICKMHLLLTEDVIRLISLALVNDHMDGQYVSYLEGQH